MAKSYLCQIFAKMSTPEGFNRNSQAEYFLYSLPRNIVDWILGSWGTWEKNYSLDPEKIIANFEDSA